MQIVLALFFSFLCNCRHGYLSDHILAFVLEMLGDFMDTIHDVFELVRATGMFALVVAVEPEGGQEGSQSGAASCHDASRAQEEHDADGDKDGAEEEEYGGEKREHDGRNHRQRASEPDDGHPSNGPRAMFLQFPQHTLRLTARLPSHLMGLPHRMPGLVASLVRHFEQKNRGMLNYDSCY